MKWLLISLVVAAIAGAIYVRVASHDPARWHVDPATVTEADLQPRNQYIGFAALELSAAETAEEFEIFITERPNVTRIAGSMDGGWATYVVTTPIIGFPDYVSVRVSSLMEYGQISIYSRSRFGYSDLGANRERVKDWIAEFREQLTKP